MNHKKIRNHTKHDTLRTHGLCAHRKQDNMETHDQWKSRKLCAILNMTTQEHLANENIIHLLDENTQDKSMQ